MSSQNLKDIRGDTYKEDSQYNACQETLLKNPRI